MYAYGHAGQEADDEDNGHHHDEVDSPSLILACLFICRCRRLQTILTEQNRMMPRGTKNSRRNMASVPAEGIADAEAAAQISNPDSRSASFCTGGGPSGQW